MLLIATGIGALLGFILWTTRFKPRQPPRVPLAPARNANLAAGRLPFVGYSPKWRLSVSPQNRSLLWLSSARGPFFRARRPTLVNSAALATVGHSRSHSDLVLGFAAI
jgi:hypothetical protein